MYDFATIEFRVLLLYVFLWQTAYFADVLGRKVGNARRDVISLRVVYADRIPAIKGLLARNDPGGQ
jgi:hypothetical protein